MTDENDRIAAVLQARLNFLYQDRFDDREDWTMNTSGGMKIQVSAGRTQRSHVIKEDYDEMALLLSALSLHKLARDKTYDINGKRYD